MSPPSDLTAATILLHSKHLYLYVPSCLQADDGNRSTATSPSGITAFLLEASARDALGEREAAGRALERALDLAEPDGLLFPFLLHPVPELLERHARQRPAHPALIRKIISGDPILGSGTDQILSAAAEHTWTVIDMAADWSAVHPSAPHS